LLSFVVNGCDIAQGARTQVLHNDMNPIPPARNRSAHIRQRAAPPNLSVPAQQAAAIAAYDIRDRGQFAGMKRETGSGFHVVDDMADGRDSDVRGETSLTF
jgi:hypothetical protein